MMFNRDFRVCGGVILLVVVIISSPPLRSIPTLAQQGFSATTNAMIIVREGPGDTYVQIDLLPAWVQVTIIERNRIGNWLRVTRSETDDEDFASPSDSHVDGWVMTGFLNYNEDLYFSEVPVNTDLADADRSTISSENLAHLYSVPIIPEISDAMAETYARGQALGNNNDIVTKVGDSNSANRLYLNPLANDNYFLGPYDFLQDTIDHFDFAESLNEGSVAARIGLNAFSIFDPIWANPAQCEPNESPLSCEYRIKKPAIVVIMFGPNDLGVLNSEQYSAQMRRLVDETMDAGIIPVLSTFSSDPAEDNWYQAVRFNLILVDIAEEYEVPLVNLWAAARSLPGYGIGSDKVHLTASGEKINFDGHESQFGVSLQNLIVLCTLDEIYHTVIMAETNP